MRKDYKLINDKKKEESPYINKFAFFRICSRAFYSIEKYETLNDDREFVQRYAKRFV